MLVDPQFDDNNCPIDYWGEGSCIDFIVEENLNPEKYFYENIHMFVPKDSNFIIKYFTLGAYICKRMIFASLKFCSMNTATKDNKFKKNIHAWNLKK